jgi:hypothetical protein
MFMRQDFTQFLTLSGLCQKAGVGAEDLVAVAVKELVDNALDAQAQANGHAGASCQVARRLHGFVVTDDAGGIPGDDPTIGGLFSIGRSLWSSKQLRKPTRGMLGNGTRVVAGTVLASGGSIEVATRGRRLLLTPRDDDDGTTTVKHLGDWAGSGTRIEVKLGRREPELFVTRQTLRWGEEAILLANGGKRYIGKSSPFWYDYASFRVLLRATPAGMTVRQFVEDYLDGCSTTKAGDLARPFGKNRPARSLDHAEMAALLDAARAATARPGHPDEPVNPIRLGAIGRDAGPIAGGGYAIRRGTINLGGRPEVLVPVVIEVSAAVAAPAAVDHVPDRVRLAVNRSPVTADFHAYRNKNKELVIVGCGTHHRVGYKGHSTLAAWINVDTPVMPITSDGKEPDLSPFVDEICTALRKAAGGAKRQAPKTRPAMSIKGAARAVLDQSRAIASGDGSTRYSPRTLFYPERNLVKEHYGLDLTGDYFDQILTEYEAELGHDLPGIARDARGILVIPHTNEEIPLGTLAVEQYAHRKWTFNKFLYIEKEGYITVLKDAGWHNKHDCALMCAKGFATRAVRDLIDMLGETVEQIEGFAVHDADAYGTKIYETIVNATLARPARKVQVINLGLDADQALKMGLPIEPVEEEPGKKKHRPVAAYAADWEEWYQSNRIELNSMPGPQFIAWLDGEMERHNAPGKVVPPKAVMSEHLKGQTRVQVRTRLTEKVLREAEIERRVEEEMARLGPALARHERAIEATVQHHLNRHEADSWRTPVEGLARKIGRAGR